VTFLPVGPRAKRRNILSPPSSAAPTAASRLSCCSTRVPAIYSSCAAGNFLNDDDFASLEFAVQFLNVPLVMVLGHTNCGAVAAAVKVVKERVELPGHLPDLVKSIEPAIAAHGRRPSDLVAASIEENVRLNVKRLIDARRSCPRRLPPRRLPCPAASTILPPARSS
jgi:carbonic anhydrase